MYSSNVLIFQFIRVLLSCNFTSNPKRFVRLHLVGECVPIMGGFVSGGCTGLLVIRYTPFLLRILFSSTYFTNVP